METFMKEKGLQESGSPTTEPLSMTDQEWNSPALDKIENRSVSETETINESIVEESEATNKEDEKWNGTGPIKNMEAFLADLQKAVDEGVKRGVKGGMEDSLEESVKKGIEDYRNSYVKKT